MYLQNDAQMRKRIERVFARFAFGLHVETEEGTQCGIVRWSSKREFELEFYVGCSVPASVSRKVVCLLLDVLAHQLVLLVVVTREAEQLLNVVVAAQLHRPNLHAHH